VNLAVELPLVWTKLGEAGMAVGTMVGTGFRRAGQLRQRDDRDVELLRQPLERARDRRQFQRAVLEPAAAAHQLDIVHDDHVQAMLGLQTAALRAHLEHADGRRVVDVQLHRAQRLERV